jgi:hypothetical protein
MLLAGATRESIYLAVDDIDDDDGNEKKTVWW